METHDHMLHHTSAKRAFQEEAICSECGNTLTYLTPGIRLFPSGFAICVLCVHRALRIVEMLVVENVHVLEIFDDEDR